MEATFQGSDLPHFFNFIYVSGRQTETEAHPLLSLPSRPIITRGCVQANQLKHLSGDLGQLQDKLRGSQRLRETPQAVVLSFLSCEKALHEPDAQILSLP